MERTEGVTPCEYARERHRNLSIWRNLWTILLYAFGIAVVMFLLLAVVFFLQEAWLPAALTALGSIAEGLGIKWVADRRAEAVREEELAYLDVVDKCSPSVLLDHLENSPRLLRRSRK